MTVAPPALCAALFTKKHLRFLHLMGAGPTNEPKIMRTVDGVTDGSLVRIIWDEGLKVASDGALALVRGARVGCHSCALTKTVPNLD